MLFVNNPSYLNETYQRFMINRFRELLPYAEVPIKLVVRGKAGQPTESLDEGVRAKLAKRPKKPERKKPKFTQKKPHPKPAKRGPGDAAEVGIVSHIESCRYTVYTSWQCG